MTVTVSRSSSTLKYYSNQNIILFDTKGWVWEVSLGYENYDDIDKEPTEDAQYFQHIVKTFKVLD